MTIKEAVFERHSVRSYKDIPLPEDVITELNGDIERANKESGLNMQLVTGDKAAFDSFLAHYGKFSGVANYITIIGKKSGKTDELAGYYGESIVLKAQTLGLNTCWVALTMNKRSVKRRCKINSNEKLVCVIAVGYGQTQGVKRKSKPIEMLCDASGKPDWFIEGMKAAAAAPTAINQQKFFFTLSGNKVSARATGGFYSAVDLGIVRYHFEIAAGKENFTWE